MRALIHDNGEGGVAVTVPSLRWLNRFMNPVDPISGQPLKDENGNSITFTQDQALTFLAEQKHGLVNYDTADDSTLPQDRTFRNAWERVGTVVSVNMTKAKALHQEAIERAADMELERLEKLSRRGQDQTAPIQAVRNALNAVDLSGATTPEELKNIWPPSIPTGV